MINSANLTKERTTMESTMTKRIIIIFSVLITVVLAAVVLTFSTGNTHSPAVDNPNDIFYEKLDGDGNVIYTITNEEMFESIKKTDGLQQLLFMIDEDLLANYFNQITEDELQDEINNEIYGTSDADEIAAMDADTKTALEESYDQNMILAGFDGNEEAYATIVLVRQAYVRDAIVENDDVSDVDIAKDFINNTFDDIKAIRIRFMSATDASTVLQHFNLLSLNSKTLRDYNGYTFKLNSLFDENDEIVQAYQTVTPYYYTEDGDIANLADDVIYTFGGNGIYVDEDDAEYTLDASGNLIDADQEIAVAYSLLFDSSDLAEAYKQANTHYYTVSKTDPSDEEESTKVYDRDGEQLAFTIDPDGTIYDHENNDVTNTTSLYVNKYYTSIENVSSASVYNSTELSNEEVLAKYIEIYNYVYGDYRSLLAEDATAEDLIALDNSYLTFNFDAVNAVNSDLATYMFETMDISDEDAIPYSGAAQDFNGDEDTYYFMVYKLTQSDKLDAESIMLDNIEANIVIPTTIGEDVTLPATGWYGSSITWVSGDTDYITSDGTVTNPEEDTLVTMTYIVAFNGTTRTGKIDVTILANGETSDTTENTDETSFQSILNNDELYYSIQSDLVEAILSASDASDTVTEYLAQMRAEYGFTIEDFYLGLSYAQVYDSYDYDVKGDKKILAYTTGVVGNPDEGVEITAQDFFVYCLNKNAAVYAVYATQYKEALYSTYFEQLFGTEKDLYKNKSDMMETLLTNVESVKATYANYSTILQAYYGYNSFQEFLYLAYDGAKSESELLENYVLQTVQAFFIKEMVDNYDILELLYPTVQDYYENYFSLDVNHLLLFFDFDEDGTYDDYFEYRDSLDTIAADNLDTLLSGFKAAVVNYFDEDSDNDLDTLVTEYRSASYDDEVWGDYKKAGFQIMTELLDMTNDDDEEESLTYSGEYGVLDNNYVTEFVDALTALYQEYILPQNEDEDQMFSDLVSTMFGIHIILATQGSGFDQPTAIFQESDPLNPVYTSGVENADGEPTLEQFTLYADYYFYSQLFDLANEDVETEYGIVVPEIPATLRTNLDVYTGDLISGLYTVGNINIDIIDRIVTGTFVDNPSNPFTDQEIKLQLVKVQNIYYQALYSEYITD